MESVPVVLKGTRGGLNIFLAHQADWPDIINALKDKLATSRPFFEGVSVNLTFTGKTLTDDQRQELADLTASFMQIGTILFQNTPEEVQQPDQANDQFAFFNGIEEGITRFIRGTVRNGQRIYYEGNVVVIGDVNPGAEVIAAGNILILGTLRGIAHAGATGNQEALVAAFCLQPTQLRIAGMITRAPEGDNTRPQYPEIAYIRNNNLMIEPYLPGKGK